MRHDKKINEQAEFLERIAGYKASGFNVEIGVESTGNTRFFKNQVEKAGAHVTVINTLKFKGMITKRRPRRS